VREVGVTSRGQRLVHRTEGADRAAGKAVWERARALRGPATNVSVRQLANASDDATAL
jgi:hypothetical protein